MTVKTIMFGQSSRIHVGELEDGVVAVRRDEMVRGEWREVGAYAIPRENLGDVTAAFAVRYDEHVSKKMREAKKA